MTRLSGFALSDKNKEKQLKDAQQRKFKKLEKVNLMHKKPAKNDIYYIYVFVSSKNSKEEIFKGAFTEEEGYK